MIKEGRDTNSPKPFKPRYPKGSNHININFKGMIGKLKKFTNNKRGAITLLSVLTLSAILLSIGTAMAFLSFFQNDASRDQEDATASFYIAESGIKDALLKIARNKNYGTTPSSYVITEENGQTDVEIDFLSFATETTPGQIRITSTGNIADTFKKIEAIVNIEIDGVIKVSSWKEL